MPVWTAASGRLSRAALIALGAALVTLPLSAPRLLAQSPPFAPVPPLQVPPPKPAVAGAFVAMTHANQRIYAPHYVIGDGWNVSTVSLPYVDPANPVSPSPAPVGSVSMFLNWGVTPWIVYRSAGGQVYLNTFQSWNVTPAKNVTFASGAPATASDVVGFDSGNGYNSIFYRGSTGHIYELFTNSAFGNDWQWGDLSAWTNAPAATGVPAAYARADGFNAVLYRGTNGHIYELYRPRNGGANWQGGDLTALTGAPLAAGDPAGFVRGDWGSAVVYRGADRQIYEIHLPPSGGAWAWGSPSGLAQAPLAKGNPSGFGRWDGVTSIVYRGMDDHIHELYLPLPTQSPGATWTHGDLTSLTAAPLADGDPVGWAFWNKASLPGGVTQTDLQNCVAYRSQRPVPLPLEVLCLETGRVNGWHRSFTGM